MPKHTLTGNIKRHRAFHSRVLRNRRDVLVYLPPDYWRFSSRRYPVLYLHDGQNVFDAATSFAGVEWGVDETTQRLIQRKLIEPLIVVAVANVGERRVDEYAPTSGVIDPKENPRKRSGGLAHLYGQFLMEELKPFIDKKYRTKPDAESTGTRWLIAWRFGHVGDWNFLFRGIHAFNGDVAIDLVGRLLDPPAGGHSR